MHGRVKYYLQYAAVQAVAASRSAARAGRGHIPLRSLMAMERRRSWRPVALIIHVIECVVKFF